MSNSMASATVRRGRLIGQSGQWTRRIVLWVLSAVFLIFFLFPFYWQTVTALKPPSDLYATPVRWFPSHIDFTSFRDVFFHFGFFQNIVNSVVVASATTALAIGFGALAAYAIAKLPLPSKEFILLAVVTMVTFPGIALVVSFFIIFRNFQLIDTYAALIIPYVAFSLPFAIWVLTNFFREIPADLAEQAEVDGATPFQALRRIILPLAMPGLATAALLVFIGAWNEFLFALTFTSTASAETVPVAIFNFNGVHEVPWGDIAAGSEVVTLPIIALVLLFQRRIVQGLTAGALKG